MATEVLFPYGDCGHRPMPWSGAYGHWACQLPQGHRGPHRFNNYTVRKGARAYGWLRYTAERARLAVGKKLGLVRPWRVAIRHTHTKYDPCDLLALHERTTRPDRPRVLPFSGRRASIPHRREYK